MLQKFGWNRNRKKKLWFRVDDHLGTKIVEDPQDLPLKQTGRGAVECNFVPAIQHDHIILFLL